jgi:sugar phosphate isomerase/epimerase
MEYCFETVNWSPYFGFAAPDVPAMIRAAASHGYSSISLDMPTIEHYCATGGSLSGLRAELDKAGVKLLALHSLAVSADLDEVDRLTRPLVAACTALGAEYLHAGVTAPVDHAVIVATRHAGQMCSDSGIGFAIEFLPFLPVASIQQTRDLLSSAGLSKKGLVIDTWHFFNGPDDWAELESVGADEIAYVQFNDHAPLASGADVLFETTQRRLLPGEGAFDLKRFAATLRAAGFDGVVGPEILSEESRRFSMDEAARRIMETSGPYWV